MVRRSFLDGMAWLAAFLGLASLLGVAAFYYPEYLTTPRLRAVYAEHHVRGLLYAGLVLATLLSLIALFFSRLKRHALLGLACVLLAWLAGGADVSYGDQVRDARFYISLDWVLLDLLLIATLFINVELFFRLRPEQGILRRGWRTDLAHYVANHIFNGAIVFALFLPAQWLAGPLSLERVQTFFAGLPVLVQLPLIYAVTDFAQYWVHRAFHSVPLLWRFHRVHHSVECMDWLAGSRLHIGEVLIARTLVLAPIVVLGFSKEVVDAYIVIVGFQAVFNHANVSVRLGPLRYVIVTPNFHHWHHAQDREALDKNYAAHFAFLDHLFGTAVQSDRQWPAAYGVLGDYVPDGFVKQLVFPFVWKG
jgi:sterol desaturase/sphingolipid hydroxylase (fatty acid hydroxylase superfamily)